MAGLAGWLAGAPLTPGCPPRHHSLPDTWPAVLLYLGQRRGASTVPLQVLRGPHVRGACVCVWTMCSSRGGGRLAGTGAGVRCALRDQGLNVIQRVGDMCVGCVYGGGHAGRRWEAVVVSTPRRHPSHPFIHAPQANAKTRPLQLSSSLAPASPPPPPLQQCSATSLWCDTGSGPVGQWNNTCVCAPSVSVKLGTKAGNITVM